MVYVIWTHAFHLPGANPGQFSFDTFDDKKEMVNAIIEFLEESREPIIYLGSEEAEDSLTEALSKLRLFLDEPNLEATDFTDKSWEIGDAEITIHLAEAFPDVLGRFQDVVLSVSEDAFSDCIDDEGDDDDDDDEFRLLYRDICSVNQSTSREEFDRIFAVCNEILSEWSTF